MTKPLDIERLIKFEGTKKVGGVTYFMPDDVNLLAIQKEYIQAISSYFTEDVRLNIRTPFAEDAEVYVYVAEDKLSKREPNKASKIKRPNVVIRKLPISVTGDGTKNYADLNKEQRDQWVITVYRTVLISISNNGDNKPLQEADKVLGKFMQLTKPNEKGEVFLEGDVESEPTQDKDFLGEGPILKFHEVNKPTISSFLDNWTAMLPPTIGGHPPILGVRGMGETESRIPLEYTITFGDKGIGIKDEKKPHWFKRFISFVKNLFKRKKS
jgi:hypothetical protein